MLLINSFHGEWKCLSADLLPWICALYVSWKIKMNPGIKNPEKRVHTLSICYTIPIGANIYGDHKFGLKFENNLWSSVSWRFIAKRHESSSSFSPLCPRRAVVRGMKQCCRVLSRNAILAEAVVVPGIVWLCPGNQGRRTNPLPSNSYPLPHSETSWAQ